MKKVLLFFVISVALISCKKEDPKPSPDFGAYYSINKASGFHNFPGDGVYYTAALSWYNLIPHPSGVATLRFTVSNDKRITPVVVVWKFAASTPVNTVSYFDFTEVQPEPGDIISAEKFDIRYD